MFIPIPIKGNAKECSDYHTIALISQASKVVFKILQARLQQFMNRDNFQVCKLAFQRHRDQIAQQGNSRKSSTSTSLIMWKSLAVWITTHCGKVFKRWEYQTTLPVSWEICMWVKNQVRNGHGTTDWFKIGKGVLYIVSTALTYSFSYLEPVCCSMSCSNCLLDPHTDFSGDR